jgi:hypothetical protein
MTKVDGRGKIPESWDCIDCGFNTAPGCLNRAEMEKAIEALGDKWGKGEGVAYEINDRSEVYTVRTAVWKEAGVVPMGGCLCIGCLEKRLGRNLRPKDFKRGDAFNQMPGTARLLKRQGRKLSPYV